ncbi:ATP-grasp domain-containing protein [Flavobacterium soli]|uniref:ATP-grasp domain-containing protein n=1 Tax=Flavobacterium soli TaxID=344881 RepID=UPI0003FA58E6|nr:ATP-grasp domain-containing protein [Flavobacterium soli]
MNILFTCAGRRNYLINYFKEALNKSGKVFASDMQLSAPAMVDADQAFLVSSIYDQNYINEIVEIIRNNNVSAVISLNDLELPILSENKKVIEDAGAKLIVSNMEVIDVAFDKVLTANFLNKIGLNTPKTFTNLEVVLEMIDQNEIKFPLVVKPRWGSASIGIDFPKDKEELELSFKLQHKRLRETILSNVSEQDIENAILIQEKMNGNEFGMDILNDFEGNYIGSFVRQKLSMRAGETDKAISIIDMRFEIIGKQISENLKHIGNLDCDIFVVDNDLYVLELNPRFGGGYPFSHEAGVNTPAIYIDLLNGSKDIKKHINYRADRMFSKCDRLIDVTK